MFAPYCTKHRSQVLLSTSDITAIEHEDDVLVAHFVCFCGQPGVWRSPSHSI